MTRRIDRRTFLQATAAIGSSLSLTVPGDRLLGAPEPVKSSTPGAEKIGWGISCQLYTFRRFPFYEALEKIAALGFQHVEPCFFLPLDKARPELKTNESLSPEVKEELSSRLAERGMKMTNFYAEVGGDAEKNRKVFQFAKEMGVRTIVAEPPPEAFDGIEKLCEEHRINLAIHNHPRSPDSRYWSPDEVLKVVKGRGKRVGGCCDTGHWIRSGMDPVECLKRMEGRIITLHLKDVIESGNPAARDVPLGTGKGNFAAVLEELHRQGYRGSPSIEYEHDSEKLVEDVSKCLAFVEAQARTLAGKKR